MVRLSDDGFVLLDRGSAGRRRSGSERQLHLRKSVEMRVGSLVDLCEVLLECVRCPALEVLLDLRMPVIGAWSEVCLIIEVVVSWRDLDLLVFDRFVYGSL